MVIRVFALAISLFFVSVCGWAQDSAPDKETLLKELETLNTQRQIKLKGDLAAILSEVTSAALSRDGACALYEKAIFAVRYEGKQKDEADFVDWKKGQKENFRSAAFTLALQMHLEYLSYAVQKLNGVESSLLSQPLIRFARQYYTNEMEFLAERKQLEPFLFKPLQDGPFARYYLIENQLSNLQQWEPTPSNAWGILEKTVFPFLRDKKSPEILTLWDERIARDKQQAEKSPATDHKIRFESQTQPSLYWGRSKDAYAIGQEKAALTEMMNLVRSYPLHPNYETWTNELSLILKK
jgi:hypothetical protein